MRLDILFLLSFLFLIIGLIACSPPPKLTPTIPPTLFPSVTLTIYNPQLIMTLTPNSLPSATILPPAPQFDAMDVTKPLCYPLESKQITCLGYVHNQSESAVGDVTLQANFISANGDQYSQNLFTLEQRTINEGELAPYRIQIPNSRLETNYLQIRLVSAQLSPETQLPIRLMNMQGTYDLEENRYELTAEVENPTAFNAIHTRLIVTLENEAGNIIGYRVAEIPDEIGSGERIPLRILMTPLEQTPTIRHRIVLEAFASETSPTPEG